MEKCVWLQSDSSGNILEYVLPINEYYTPPGFRRVSLPYWRYEGYLEIVNEQERTEFGKAIYNYVRAFGFLPDNWQNWRALLKG